MALTKCLDVQLHRGRGDESDCAQHAFFCLFLLPFQTMPFVPSFNSYVMRTFPKPPPCGVPHFVLFCFLPARLQIPFVCTDSYGLCASVNLQHVAFPHCFENACGFVCRVRAVLFHTLVKFLEAGDVHRFPLLRCTRFFWKLRFHICSCLISRFVVGV